ncbi:unnamed protein product [Lasius platythorax]|uniref:DUF1907 domain-containing protein n=1 Tax=Lasius platythorax TaxID=488582 RepID=A0AAV2NAG2_9HYME
MEYLPKDFEDLDDVEDKDDDLKYKNHDFDYERTSWNSATLKDVRDVLYELREYFDEFKIAVVACPCLTRSPYNLDVGGLSGNMNIFETDFPLNMLIEIPDLKKGPMRLIPSRSINIFVCDRRPGMVLKIRAKGRKTNYSIITLIQSILHKRFSYKMGLGGVLSIKGGRMVQHVKSTSSDFLNEQYMDCDPVQTAIGTIVNDPVVIVGQQRDGVFLTNNCYMFHFFSENGQSLFINDVTPKETEYVGYFNVAEKVTSMVVTKSV